VSASALRESALSVFREAHWAAKALRSLERKRQIEKTTRAFTALFRKQGRAFMEVFPRFAGLFAAEEVQEASYDGDLVGAFSEIFGATQAEAEEAIFGAMVGGLTTGYAELAGDFGIEASFKLKPERAARWARDNAAVKVTKINATTEATIRDMIVTGINEGTSYGEMGRTISKRFNEFAEGRPQHHIRSRAELVAVQENAMAYEAGAASLVDDIEAVGITMEKSIGGPDDEHTSDICRQAMAMEWVPRDTVFPGGEMTAPLHVACRHDTRYRVAEG